jgi:RHS repeat-associated protein
LTQVDAAGHKATDNSFDGLNGHLLSTKDVLGHITSFGYDSGIGSGQTGELLSKTDAANNATTYIVNSKGWRMYQTDALGEVTGYTRDSLGRVTGTTRSGTDINGQAITLTTSFTLDAKGRATQTVHPDGSVETAEYNAIDQVTKTCDASNRCTSFEYDNRGQLTRTIFADGASESKQYDANGNVIAQTDRAGRTTKFVFDAANRLTETIAPDVTPATDADNPRTLNVYDKAGRLVATSDPNGNTTTFGYDQVSRRTSVTDALGRTATTEFDVTGQKTATVNIAGRRTEFRYDQAGRQTETVFDDGTSAKVEYDAVGQISAEVDPLGRRTEYQHDVVGRLIAVKSAEGTSAETITRYRYDLQGNRTEQTDAEARTTCFEHDVVGRETARSLPLGQRETKQYNALGQLAAHTDFGGKTTSFGYDLIGRLIAIDYPNDADVSFEYTANGQRAKVTDGNGTTTYSYDERGRLLRKVDSFARAIEYSYDLAGNLLSRVTASQSLVYTYDQLNRVTSVTSTVGDEAPTLTRYEYDQTGARSAMVRADGTRTEYAYDRLNRLTSLSHKTTAGALLLQMNYQLDAAGMRTSAQESDASGTLRTVGYQYDALKRLTNETIVARDSSLSRVAFWTYDKVGNRLSQTITPSSGASIVTSYVYDQNDRLTTETTGASVISYSYDANGNTLSKSSSGQLVEYAYNDADRLKELRQGGDRTTYAYTADGMRIAQTSYPANGTPTATQFLLDSNRSHAQAIEEWTSNNGGTAQLAAVFTFGPELISQTRNGATRFVLADGMGSTRLLTDAGGNVTDSFAFDAFGNEIARSGATEVEHRYRGERMESASGLYDLRARYMDPKLGRFVNQDTFRGVDQSPVSLHKYLYANGDPVGTIDPSGHFGLAEMGAGIEALGILAVAAEPGLPAQQAGMNDKRWQWHFKNNLGTNPRLHVRVEGETKIFMDIVVGPAPYANSDRYYQPMQTQTVREINQYWNVHRVSLDGHGRPWDIKTTASEWTAWNMLPFTGGDDIKLARGISSECDKADAYVPDQIDQRSNMYYCSDPRTGAFGHEFGHVLGFKDARDENYKALTDDDDIMVGYKKDGPIRTGEVQWYHARLLSDWYGK